MSHQFSVLDFGALGDGIHDDSFGFQQAINAAAAVPGAEVLIPPPPRFYALRQTVYIRSPDGGAQCCVSLRGTLTYNDIRWEGPDRAAVFQLTGLKDAVIQGVHVQVPDTASEVTAWDCRARTGAVSMSNVLWQTCRVTFGTGGNNVGWRSLPAPGGPGDFAMLRWAECGISGRDPQVGDVGWHNGTTNSLPWTLTNCSAGNIATCYLSGPVTALQVGSVDAMATRIVIDDASGFPPSGTVQVQAEQVSYTGLASMLPSLSNVVLTGCTRGSNGTVAASHVGNSVVNLLPAGASVVPIGGPCLSWQGGGTSGCKNAFQFTTAGTYSIEGRFEDGEQFVRIGNGGSFPINVVCRSCQVRGFSTSRPLFMVRCAGQLRFEGGQISAAGGNLYGSVVEVRAATPTFGSVCFSDCGLQISGSPVNIVSPAGSAGWKVAYERVQKLDVAGRPAGFF